MNSNNGDNLSQVVLGLLAAFISIAVVFGSLLLAFAEGGVGQAFVRTLPKTPTFTEIPRITAITTLKPDQETLILASTETAAPTATETAACPLPSGWVTVTVQSGETLETIAESYGVSVQRLKDANCLLTDRLLPGLLLYVPAQIQPTATPEPEDTLAPSRTPVPCGPLPCWVRYRVQRGDTLYSLATSTGTTVREVQFANCMGYSTSIQAGQILYLPKTPPTKTPEPEATRTPTATTTAPPNIPPVAKADSYSVNEDAVLNVTLPGVLGNDTDSNGDPLTAVLIAGPASGSLALNPNGSFTYTPPANFYGTVTFTYRANDGKSNSNSATVTITVSPVNDTPVANDDSYSVDEDGSLDVLSPGVLGNDTDLESGSLTATLIAGPASGTFTFAADGSFTYTPPANFNGTVNFTYRANDGSADSNTATVTIIVNPVNDAPVAVDDSYQVTTNETLSILAAGVLSNDSDVDGDLLTAFLDSLPTEGNLTLNSDGSFTYEAPAAAGSFTFTYHASDNSVSSNTATVTITVISP